MHTYSIDLPVRLLRALQQLAVTYREQGLNLFVFGSFARGDQRPNSDLDLGVEWVDERDPTIFLRLYGDVQKLPTIRKIELVDFTQVAPDFLNVVAADKIYLSEMESQFDDKEIKERSTQEQL